MFPSEKKDVRLRGGGEDARVGALPTGGMERVVESKVQRRSRLESIEGVCGTTDS
jgi:hypothetical protein